MEREAKMESEARMDKGGKSRSYIKNYMLVEKIWEVVH